MPLLFLLSFFFLTMLTQADINWHKDFKTAQQEAIKSKKPLLLVFR